jgi:hypothetical protein
MWNAPCHTLSMQPYPLLFTAPPDEPQCNRWAGRVRLGVRVGMRHTVAICAQACHSAAQQQQGGMRRHCFDAHAAPPEPPHAASLGQPVTSARRTVDLMAYRRKGVLLPRSPADVQM